MSHRSLGSGQPSPQFLGTLVLWPVPGLGPLEAGQRCGPQHPQGLAPQEMLPEAGVHREVDGLARAPMDVPMGTPGGVGELLICKRNTETESRVLSSLLWRWTLFQLRAVTVMTGSQPRVGIGSRSVGPGWGDCVGLTLKGLE